ncbi:uncharacterized protein LOC111342268 isoform X2 [Stylophora pistillata]|uniref:uncharacterized protein LOC111342268 isoform X2 n=1 Tax=Stylophora pistillata TaxID=50429 RepID=UPI000C05450E|nr:uncharacterized protein LOC111342268 isoform X2 [Stylophora pistillata]
MAMKFQKVTVPKEDASRNDIKLKDLDSWNPMLDDYESKVFNSYKEPSMTDFADAFPSLNGNSGDLQHQHRKSSLEINEKDTCLFVGNIPQKMTQEGLQNLFQQAGQLRSCKLIPQHNKSTKIGFVSFNTVREAVAAIQMFDGLDLGHGNRLKVALALSKQKPAFTDTMMRMGDGVSKKVEVLTDDEVVSSEHEGTLDAVSSVLPDSKLTSEGSPCSFCGQLGHKWCSACKIPYCSRDCQRNDWPKHKHACCQQTRSERKRATLADTSETCLETASALTSAANSAQQASPTYPCAPCDDSTYSSKEPTISATPANSDKNDDKISNKANQESLRVADSDAFDVQNAEMFAQMMGFDPNPVTTVENSDDSDSADTSTSPSLMSNMIHRDSSPQVPHTETGLLKSSLESQVNRSNLKSSLALESVSTSDEAVTESETSTSELSSCTKGPTRIPEQLQTEKIPTEDFEVIVTEVENPSCLWVHSCASDALERRNQLQSILQATYRDSVFEKYVPSVGDVCVAQFSFDNCWYRVKVDLVINAGIMRVTYIDFGNQEDIAVYKIRRITEDLLSLPRQAVKISLYGITSTSPSGDWSSESTIFLKSEILAKRCKVRVCEQANETLLVELSAAHGTRVGETVNETLIKSGFAEIKSPRDQADRSHGLDDLCEEQIGSPDKSSYFGDISSKRPLKTPSNEEGRNPPRLHSQSKRGKVPFEIVVNAIVNPWEFYVMKTEKQLIVELRSLMVNLNHHLSENRCRNECSTTLLTPGDLCAAQFSQDKVWYRAVVLERVPNGYRVRYVDFGNSEVLQKEKVCSLPESFQRLPPLSLTCSLAGVKKPKTRGWTPEAIQQFKTLVADRTFLCRIVYTHGVTNIVELLDPNRGEEESIANSLIGAGLADPFAPKDGHKEQIDSRWEMPFITPQCLRSVETSVKMSPSDFVTDRSPSSQPRPKINANCVRSSSPKGQILGTSEKERIESVVFEPAIQAAMLPQDNEFDILVTEVVSPGLIFFQLGTVESVQSAVKLTEDMNLHYKSATYPPFVPHQNNLCAAFFAGSGDWCRAFIKAVSPDGSVSVHYVDYGNAEILPPNHLRPLIPQFDSSALPFLALSCSLANIVPLDKSEWSDEAVAFAKAQIPLFSRSTVRLVGRQKGRVFLEVKIDDESVNVMLVNRGLARAMVKGYNPQRLNSNEPTPNTSRLVAVDRNALSNGCYKELVSSALESLVFCPAIQAAVLPQDSSLFDVMITEVSKAGVFFIQVGDFDAALSLQKLSEKMNSSYHSSPSSSFKPQPNHFCAAKFTETGDWCRAFIKEVTPQHLVEVHYVDFGNAEKLPVSSIHPLMDNLTTYPFFALPCSLANVRRPKSPGWADKTMELIKEKVPLFKRVSARIISKQRGMLLVDFMVSKDQPQFLSQLLLNEGLAQRSVVNERQYDDEQMEIQVERSQSHDLLKDAPSPKPLGSIESLVFQPAIQSTIDFDSFHAMLTEVVSPSSLFIQILSHEMVESMEQLSANLNAHYNNTNYPPFKVQANVLCAGFFSESGDWCRAFINGVNADGSINLHYLDYGNSEVCSSSQIRPLEKTFQKQPPMAIKCSLHGICPVQSTGWAEDTCKALLSQVPLFSRLDAKVIKRESESLVIDATSRLTPEQVTLSQFLVNHGMARWQDFSSAPKDVHTSEEQMNTAEQASLPAQFAFEAVSSNSNRFFVSKIPLVDISQSNSFQVLISEVQRPDKIFFQVLNKGNAHALDTLSRKLNTYCSEVDNSPYKPVLGELCCARFNQDGVWYRAVVEQELPGSRMSVLFVDYGNEDAVTVDSIRRITAEFTQLPLQARQCFLTGILPVSQSWSSDAVNFLRGRLSGETFVAQIENVSGESVGVQLFEHHPRDLPPHMSVNQDMVEHNLARIQEQSVCLKVKTVFPKEDHFDVVITEVIHPGEMWGQVLDAESHNKFSLLMEQINQYCVSAAPVSTFLINPTEDCCALFSQDDTWYRARVLECLESGKKLVQFVDFGNCETVSSDMVRSLKDDFGDLPAQALKLSLANIRPIHQIWSQEAVDWLKNTVNRRLKVSVVHRWPDQLNVFLEDWNVPDGPLRIGEELVCLRFADEC